MTPYRFSLLRIYFGILLIFAFFIMFNGSQMAAAIPVYVGMAFIAVLLVLGYQRPLVSRSLIFFCYLLFAFENSVLQLNNVLILIGLAYFAVVEGQEPWRVLAEKEVPNELNLKKLKLFSALTIVSVFMAVIVAYGPDYLIQPKLNSSFTQGFIGFFLILLYPAFLFKARPKNPAPILFFDGVCGLCNKVIDFVFTEDKQSVFKVATLQGETAKEKLSQELRENLNSVVVLSTDGQFYQKSEAILIVLYEIGGFWRLFFILRLIPRPLCDVLYSLVAKFRYKIFGKKDTCRLPTAAEREKFLN